jgi:AcrR family transcriptional regulator
VARTRAPGRLQDILDAALDVFSNLGYRRARMQDVAQAAGVSPGLLYTYAAGKEALFSLVIQREAGIDVDTLTLPVPNPDAKDFEAVVDRVLRAAMRGPSLDAVERTPAATDARAELRAIVGELYDRISEARRLLRLIERTALDWPELADRFYNRGRRPFVQRLGRYIARRIDSGDFRSVPHPEVAARFVLESASWFANHRLGDHDGKEIDDAVARETVVELVTNSLVA